MPHDGQFLVKIRNAADRHVWSCPVWEQSISLRYYNLRLQFSKSGRESSGGSANAAQGFNLNHGQVPILCEIVARDFEYRLHWTFGIVPFTERIEAVLKQIAFARKILRSPPFFQGSNPTFALCPFYSCKSLFINKSRVRFPLQGLHYNAPGYRFRGGDFRSDARWRLFGQIQLQFRQ